VLERGERPRGGDNAADRGLGFEISLKLPFRGVLHVPWMRWFLTDHAAPGIEEVRGGDYRCTVRLPHGPGIIRAQIEPEGQQVCARFQLTDARDLTAAVNRTRRLFDLDADPETVDQALAKAAPQLAGQIARSPGLRLPGGGDPAELILRTMIGQQISVAAARTHTSRLAEALGEPIQDQAGTLNRLFPTPEAIVADAGASLRGPAVRKQAILAVAQALSNGKLAPHTGMSSTELRRRLLELPGVGPWTSDYVALRFLGDPDVLLDTDLVVKRGAESLGIDLKDTSRFAPWRSYLCLRLWQHALEQRGTAV
jgi:AraC family transcriptional regulator of adaptative response / DNA-3-methyladenine glycosylase II